MRIILKSWTLETSERKNSEIFEVTIRVRNNSLEIKVILHVMYVIGFLLESNLEYLWLWLWR